MFELSPAFGFNSFNAGESAGVPDFNINFPGYSQQKARQSYGDCILRGGSAEECGASAASAGFPSGTNITPVVDNKNLSWMDRVKLYGAGVLSASTGNFGMAANAAQAAATGNAKWTDLTVSRIATLAVGLLFIIGGFILFKSSANVIINAVKSAGEIASE